MNLHPNFRIKLTFYILRRQSQSGFTLLELMVVLVFMAVFMALALPNLVRQAGKAREVEFKNTVGSINRAQQAYHWEKTIFAQGATDEDTLRLLNIDFDRQYIDSYNIVGVNTQATVAPTNPNYDQDQTRAYSGATYFSSGIYSTIICQSRLIASVTLAPASSSDCGASAEKVR